MNCQINAFFAPIFRCLILILRRKCSFNHVTQCIEQCVLRTRVLGIQAICIMLAHTITFPGWGEVRGLSPGYIQLFGGTLMRWGHARIMQVHFLSTAGRWIATFFLGRVESKPTNLISSFIFIKKVSEI